jgi:hypothetical protein
VRAGFLLPAFVIGRRLCGGWHFLVGVAIRHQHEENASDARDIAERETASVSR